MKSIFSVVLLSGLFVLSPAQAHEGGHDDAPCKRIRTACETAGFKLGKGEKKNLKKDCIHPIMEGKTIDGVKVEAADIEACKEKRKAHHDAH